MGDRKRITVAAGGTVFVLALTSAARFGVFPRMVATVIALPGWALLPVGTDTGKWWQNATVTLVSAAFWLAVVACLLLLAKRRLILSGLAFIGIASYVLGVGFRSTCVPIFDSTEVCCDRSWGFVTRVRKDTNGDGNADYESLYSWRRPFIDLHVSTPLSSRQDANLDGHWDTWYRHDESLLSVDIDGDGNPDWDFPLDSEGVEEAKRVRGY